MNLSFSLIRTVNGGSIRVGWKRGMADLGLLYSSREPSTRYHVKLLACTHQAPEHYPITRATTPWAFISEKANGPGEKATPNSLVTTAHALYRPRRPAAVLNFALTPPAIGAR
ncbi:hypothetical protein ACJBU6_00555 [Exserohilum turcicum]